MCGLFAMFVRGRIPQTLLGFALELEVFSRGTFGYVHWGVGSRKQWFDFQTLIWSRQTLDLIPYVRSLRAAAFERPRLLYRVLAFIKFMLTKLSIAKHVAFLKLSHERYVFPRIQRKPFSLPIHQPLQVTITNDLVSWSWNCVICIITPT